MNTGVYVSFQTIVFFRYMSRNGIAGSYGNSVFSFWRNLHMGLTGCSNLYPQQKYGRASFLQKQRHYFANKGLSSQGYGFSSGHVWMWELDCEESWVLKNWCFWTVVLEKTLESPLDSKEIQPVHPKELQLEKQDWVEMMVSSQNCELKSWEDWNLKQEYFNYFLSLLIVWIIMRR